MRFFIPAAILLCASASAAQGHRSAPDAPAEADVLCDQADERIRKAREADSLIERDRLRDQAVALLETAARRLPDDEQHLVEHLRLKLRLAETLGVLSVRPYAARLTHFQGCDRDRQIVLSKTARALPLLGELPAEIDGLLHRWRDEPAKLIDFASELEELQARAEYRSAWVSWCRALAMRSETPEQRRARVDLLQQAVASARKYTDSDIPAAVRRPALLVMGRACALLGTLKKESRRGGWFDKALRCLRLAAASDATAEVRLEARFALAATLIAEGQWDEAEQAIAKLLEEHQSAPACDATEAAVKAAVLRWRLYNRKAEAAANPEAVDALRRRAEEELAHPAGSIPGVREEWCTMVGRMYRGRKLAAQSPPAIALAVARDAASRDKPTEAERALRAALSRDPDSWVRREALRQLGFLLAEQGRCEEAGECFWRLAAADGEGRFDAARNAVSQYVAAVRNYERSDAPVPLPVRRWLIDALELLLAEAEDASDSERNAWAYELGCQCRQMGRQVRDAAGQRRWLARAAEAFGRVGPADESYWEARYWSLRLRAEQARRRRQTGDTSQAADLVAELRRYARRVAEQKTDGKRLRGFAARADFFAAVLQYEVLDQPTEALDELAVLPERWPEADVLGTAGRYRIDKLLDRGQTEQAVTELRSCEQRYGPVGADLLERAARRLREAFRVRPAAQAEERASLVAAYLDCTRRLYAERSERPIGQRYEITQLLADARLWSGYLSRSRGRADEAEAHFRSSLEMFEQCRKHNRRRRAGSDPASLLGVARAQAALGRDRAARDEYAKLLDLLDRHGDPQLFWRAELEYCTCLLEGFRSQRETLSALAVRIRQLRQLDEHMGGWKEAFDRLAREVEVARQSLARGDRR